MISYAFNNPFYKAVRSFFLALTILVFSGSLAFADGGFVGGGKVGGGFSGPGPDIVTIQQAKQMRDDAKVVLEGTISRQIGKEKYLFQDATGTIVVEIDDEDWNGLTVSPDDRVQIWGEVDKDWNSVEIDVDRIMKK